jgi:hypothetical protein
MPSCGLKSSKLNDIASTVKSKVFEPLNLTSILSPTCRCFKNVIANAPDALAPMKDLILWLSGTSTSL